MCVPILSEWPFLSRHHQFSPGLHILHYRLGQLVLNGEQEVPEVALQIAQTVRGFAAQDFRDLRPKAAVFSHTGGKLLKGGQVSGSSHRQRSADLCCKLAVSSVLK